MLIGVYIRSFLIFLKKNLFELNLFNNGIEDEIIIQNQRRSTRLYLFLLISSMFSIALYNIITVHVQTMVIKSPSFNEYSSIEKQTSLQCFCTKIAIKYEEFIQVKPTYHELCESHLISNEYINQLYSLYEDINENSTSIDFHRIAVFQFITLRNLCQLTKETIENHLKTFLQTDFIHSQLFSQQSLQIQMTSLLIDFIDFIPKTFLMTLIFIQNITAQSLFMTGASVTSVLPIEQWNKHIEDIIPYQGINYTFSDGLSCTCSSSTSTTCMGLTTFENETISGFQTGCYMLSALFKSTLEVFYNQTFVDLLTQTSNQFQKLNSSFSNQTIEELLSQMFVVQWINETYFEKYFSQCTPDSCQYTIIERYDLLYIITSLIGLFGGLSSILKIIVPFIFSIIWPTISKLKTKGNNSQIIIVVKPVNPISTCDRIKNVFQSLKQMIKKFNLFKSIPPSTNEHILHRERYTTRIYIIILILTTIIIIIFTTITGQTTHFNIKSPSLNTFISLYDQYPLTLTCPCNQTAIDQKYLSYIEPEYHEICLSQFLSSNWINFEFSNNNSSTIYTRDIRYHWKIYFQLLSTLCRMSQQTIEDSLQSFYRTKYITSHALNQQTFQIQINLLIENFKRTISLSFQTILNLIKTNFEINQFITPINSEFQFTVMRGNPLTLSIIEAQSPNTFDCLSSKNTNISKCKCHSTSNDICYRHIAIDKNGSLNSIIPGIFQTWFPFQSILISTLECLYNETCLLDIQQLINSSTNLTLLKSNIITSTTIEILANNLFIQSWKNESLFESYFNQCYPLTCQYSIQIRLNFIYIITKILGLIGGINIVLRLFLPFIIILFFKFLNIIFQIKRIRSVSRRQQFYNHFRSTFKSTKKHLIELNLFPTIPPSQDPIILERNRRTTRIYLILLITTLIILTLYGLLRQETNTIIIESPSISTYYQLLSQYSLTLECFCSNTAIKYNKFITQIEPQYHEICSSIFISSSWQESIDSLYIFSYGFTGLIDYRNPLRLQFQALAQLCRLSQNTVNTSLTKFGQNNFITSHIISPSEFHFRTETIFEQFKISISQQFMETFKLIQLTNYGNQLGTVFSSNWEFIIRNSPDNYQMLVNNRGQTISVLTMSQIYNDCSCGIQTNCSALSYRIAFAYPSPANVEMPGFHTGCLFFDSLLQSTLACLYNRSCLSFMQTYLYHSKPIKANILKYSSLSPPHTKIETLLNQLFVSQWFQNTSFDHYFDECRPQSCQYSYLIQYNTIYVITILIALFGGLTNGLHIFVYYTELIFIKLITCRKNINSITPHSQNLRINTIEQISDPIVTTSIKSVKQRKYRNRALLICLILLAIGAFITTSIILFQNQKKEEKIVSTTTQTIVTSSSTIDTTTETTNTCYMTIKHQSETYSTDGINPVAMITGDFNQDSIIDLIVVNSDSDSLSIMLGKGNGTFQISQIFSTGNGSRPEQIKTTDFNNDTLLDLIVILAGTNEIVIYFGDTTSNLFVLSPYIFPFYNESELPTVIEVADMNSDGFIDVILILPSNSSSNEDIINVFLNSGDGYQFDLGLLDPFWIEGNISAIVIHDSIDNEVYQISLCSNTGSIQLESFYGYNNTLYYSFIDALTLNGYPTMMIKGTFNDDTIDDFAIISPETDTFHVVISLAWLRDQQIYLIENYPTAIARINFNNDSFDDVAILTCNGTITVYVPQGNEILDNNDLFFKINTNNNNNNSQCFHSLHVVDLNQDTRDDLVFIDAEMNQIRVALGVPCDE